MKYPIISLLLLFIVLISACEKTSIDTTVIPTTTTFQGTGSVTQGLAKTTISSLFSCTVGRATGVGTILLRMEKFGLFLLKITSLIGQNYLTFSTNVLEKHLRRLQPQISLHPPQLS